MLGLLELLAHVKLLKMKKTTFMERAMVVLHVDAQIITTLIFRFWGVLSGGVTLILIPLFMGPVEQGYYFTFASILALQVFFELGFGQVIIQFVAHEEAMIEREGGMVTPSGQAFYRLHTLANTLKKWYWIASILFFLCVNVVGVCFFQDSELRWHNWLFPWMLLCLSTAYNLGLSWRLSFLEGFGLVKEIGILRLCQSSIGFVLMWVLLVTGFQLWIVAAVPTIAAFCTTIWLARSEIAKILGTIENAKGVARVPGIWFKEILPFQWKIAVSWISGFFIFQLFTPIIFKNYGAVESGRVGLAITVFNSVTTVSIAWVSAKVPAIARLLALGARHEASRMFKRLAQVSVSFSLVAAVAVVLGAELASTWSTRIHDRLPELSVMIALACASVANCFVISCALFMRAHKEEPMLLQSVVMACVVLVAVLLSVPYGIGEIMWSYSALCIFLSVPWTLFIVRERYFLRSVPM